MYRTLRDALDTLGAGVGGPIELYTLTNNKGWKVEDLTGAEIKDNNKTL